MPRRKNIRRNRLSRRRVQSSNRKFEFFMQKKTRFIFILSLLLLLGLTGRIIFITMKSGEEFSKRVLSQQTYDSQIIPYRRGDIVDRNGTILATSNRVYNIIFDCRVINAKSESKEPTLEAIHQIFGIPKESLEELLTAEDTKASSYQIIKRKISVEEKRRFDAYIDLKSEENQGLEASEKEKRRLVAGIWFEEDYDRYYPNDDLASQVIGFTLDGNVGNWGLEGYYNQYLNGSNGRRYGYVDEDSTINQTLIPAQDGKTIVSTIDYNIQKLVEEKIKKWNTKVSASGVEEKASLTAAVIVANPNNGEILAMATSDSYNLNQPRDLSRWYKPEEIEGFTTDELEMNALNNKWRNYCISDTFEAGSTVKVETIAMAVDADVVKGADKLVCNGGIQFTDYYIKCHVYPAAHGEITMTQAIAQSCNSVLMQVADKMGRDTFARYQRSFGYGEMTGIDLPGESNGIIFRKENLNEVELATSSFGQGFTNTMIQNLMAFNATINGGYLYKPHMVNKILDWKGNILETIDPVIKRQVVSSEAVKVIRQGIRETVNEGTGTLIKSEGYDIGGKTGTAEKLPRGNGKYVMSVIATAPVEDPQITIYVVLDEPDEQDGSKVHMHICRELMEEILPYLSVYPK